MTETVGAGLGERTAVRTGYRSGYYSRGLVTRVGKLELLVPRDGHGRISTELFDRSATPSDEVWMQHAAGVPELQEDAAAGAVYGVRDGLPRLRGARGEDAGGSSCPRPCGSGVTCTSSALSQPTPCGEMAVASETIKPADARCA